MPCPCVLVLFQSRQASAIVLPNLDVSITHRKCRTTILSKRTCSIQANPSCLHDIMWHDPSVDISIVLLLIDTSVWSIIAKQGVLWLLPNVHPPDVISISKSQLCQAGRLYCSPIWRLDSYIVFLTIDWYPILTCQSSNFCKIHKFFALLPLTSFKLTSVPSPMIL